MGWNRADFSRKRRKEAAPHHRAGDEREAVAASDGEQMEHQRSRQDRPRPFGLRLFWLSPVHQGRERMDTQWYMTNTGREQAMEKFLKEQIGGKPRFTRVEKLEK